MSKIGELLRERREAFGVSVAEAARWCRTTPDKLADFEASDDLSSTDFECLCQGLAIGPGDLLRNEHRSPARSVARFRTAASAPIEFLPSDVRMLAAAAEVGRVLGALVLAQSRELAFERYRDICAIPETAVPWEHGYELGEEDRERMGPPNGPIIHLEQALALFGIHVARIGLQSSGVEAASVWEPGAVPIILLNLRVGRVRYSLSRRAILAHELCHLLHDGGEADIATRVTASEESGSREDAVEQRARAFAPAYLAPRREVIPWARSRRFTGQPRDIVIELAREWGLSFEGAVWHTKNCGLISPEEAGNLSRIRTVPELPQDLFDAEELGFPSSMLHGELSSKPSPLMDGWATSVVVDALEASVISLGRARELLLWQ